MLKSSVMCEGCRRCVRLTLIGVNVAIAFLGLTIIIWNASHTKGDIVTRGKAGILSGLIVFVFAVVGSFGAYTRNICLLVTYAVVLGLLTFTSAILAAIFSSQSKIPPYKRHMYSIMYEYYRNQKSREEWDAIQEWYECCGFNGPYDWKRVPSYPGVLPESCGDVPLNRNGCWEIIGSSVESVLTISKVIFITLALTTFIGLICSCYVAVSPENYEPTRTGNDATSSS